MLILMILLFLKLHKFIKQIVLNMKPLLRNGLRNMLRKFSLG